MTAAEALATIRRLGAAGRFYMLPHARQRARERGVTPRDVQHGLANAAAAAWQADRGTWKVTSVDLNEVRLILAVVIEASAVVVTVY